MTVQLKKTMYIKTPRIEEIDREIQLTGIKYNKAILLGTEPTEKVIDELLVKLESLKRKRAASFRILFSCKLS